MSGQKLPPKKDVALALLERASVFVHLDPRKDDVRVPKWFRGQPQLVLQVGLNMAVPIPDLSLEDDALSCTLSFSRTPFFCFVPWGAVYALVGEDGRGMVWPDDVPKEVASQSAGKKSEAPSKKPGLRVIEGADGKTEEASAPLRTDPSAAKKPDANVADLASRRSAPPPPQPAVAGAEEMDGARIPEAPKLEVVQGVPAKKPRRRKTKRAEADESKATNRKKKKRQLPPYLRVVK